MNGFGTVRTRPLPAGFLATGWVDGNLGENQVSTALFGLGIKVAYSGASPAIDCHQQHRVGPYTLDFAWPKLRIALEADGSAHGLEGMANRDRVRDAWLRGQGWLTFRVDTGKQRAVKAQVARVAGVVRALART